jgi:hypothetical protein
MLWTVFDKLVTVSYDVVFAVMKLSRESNSISQSVN